MQSLTNTGLFKRAQEARNATENAELKQQTRLNEYENALSGYYTQSPKPEVKLVADNINTLLSTTDNIELNDAYGNKIVVPAGFKIVSDSTTNNAQTVNKGIVIEDATKTTDGAATSTSGSQFVWIPVGTIYTDVEHTDANKKTIELGRYEFDTNGIKSAYSGNYVEEDQGDTTAILNNYGNTIAKNITNFKNSVTTNGGYYIGRYEARQKSGKITVVKNDTVWNNITQPNAAAQARNMYQNATTLTSDLMNSYAWDTAILFLQICGTNNKYSRQNSLNTGSSPSITGTANDVQCNVYDMASNVIEWTTETTDRSTYPCVTEGGGYINSSLYTSLRRDHSTSSSGLVSVGFRPLLYVNV